MNLRILQIIFAGGFFLSYPVQFSFAQIIQDNTLPTNSQPIQSGVVTEIRGGTEAGINLFHSFEKFSVGDGETARFFNNNTSIKNVIGRVTEPYSSSILGQIVSGGTSPIFNLFLINPYGITFGPKASLNLNGSFIATTANAIQFGDQGFYNTSRVIGDPSLLKINPSAFFFNQIRPQNISVVRAVLEVPNGNSLILLGGKIDLFGGVDLNNNSQGVLKAPDGRVEIGGLEGVGTVSLSQSEGVFRLGFPDNVARADVSLVTGNLDVSGSGIGSIALNAQNITLSENSFVFSGINPGLEANSNPGAIVLNATQSVNLNTGSLIISSVGFPDAPLAIGNSGPIFINAGFLNLYDTSGILTFSFGKGNAGDITLKIRDGVTLSGSNERNVTGIGSGVFGNQKGNSGNIKINSGWLSLSDGAIIRSTVNSQGNTGNISIHVDDSVVVENNSQSFTTQIRTAVEAGAIGNGGNVEIRARSLRLTGGGQLSAAVLGPNPDNKLIGGKGNGGNISVITTDSVVISGLGLDGYASGIFADTEPGAMGSAGNVSIATKFLEISKGGEIKLSNPFDQAGTLEIKANSMTLNQGKITAETGGGSANSGANIKITLSDFLRIENESLISAKATDTADGGNIIIDTPVLIALQATGLEGSDIIASAELGKGGDITINAQGVFGIEKRTANSANQTNDFNASSDFGQSGQVQINTTTDVNQGLVELPATVLDLNTIISQHPCDRGWNSSFTLKGRGGNPQTPRQDLSPAAIQVGLVDPAPMTNTSAIENHNLTASVQGATKLQPPTDKQISPAQGWVYNSKGEVVLVAYNPTLTAEQRLQQHPVCTAKE